jgi:predicted NAD/FAD-binding protein
MPFEILGPLPRRIAVIGGGISGMAAAHMLADRNAVVLFEAEPRLGGHARTVIAGKHGDQPVDTGFIVFNKVNYPHLLALFDKLQVPLAKSDMGFGASIRGGWLEYGLRNLDSLFAQRANAGSPRFLRLCRDILYFNKHAEAAAAGSSLTIGGLLEKLGTSAWFRDYYITPISGAIWSTPVQGILEFPAEALIRFFKNHALLGVTGQHQRCKAGRWNMCAACKPSYCARARICGWALRWRASGALKMVSWSAPWAVSGNYSMTW